MAGLLDFDTPIALLALLVLQYFPDTDEVTTLIRQYRQALPAGSVVVLSHVTGDDPAMPVAEATRLSQNTDNPTYARTRDEFAALFADALLIDPGIVFAQHWHPDSHNTDPEHTCVYTAATHARA
ncbi:S-adenosyl methyltransferase [Halopolyspora algeriensis]|uniref:S-adenosyl methyltransferase n=1 Tax=Halopolyspora algeriensis TaxID=1500506 RepID=A0A368VIM5_9ACTN|nr:S-adenosyl methyltransferase [Halopolyspora algeriensis]